MRAVVQRSKYSAVYVDERRISSINKGLVVFLGVGEGDNETDVDYMADKIVNLRIFEDEGGKLNLSCIQAGGEILVVSQFTLYGDCRKGRRPSFTSAAKPEMADKYYREFIKKLKGMGLKVAQGVFGADMTVEINNHGPITILLDSRKRF
ncbi:MAG: D-tyrosyl-tRNA(Tyr) deacylase [Clostridia bacterium]|nr:D-tyrosyl-tRNA(Tyr) deacylase [Clostridia bacterium]